MSAPPSHRARHGALGSPRPPVAARLWSAAALLVAWAGEPAVPAAWWQDTIPGALRGSGDALAAAGRLSGLPAAYLLPVLVALTARIPWLENRVGSDVVARRHRALGEYTVLLAATHAAPVVLGHARQSGTGPLAEAGTVLLHSPDVLLAATCLGPLVLVGALSARAVRRRLRYETWCHLHLLVHPAAGLAFAHEFSVGASPAGDLTGPGPPEGNLGLLEIAVANLLTNAVKYTPAACRRSTPPPSPSTVPSNAPR
ncbi:hypothetical protein Kpho02_64130 [Kitasatospora phosalacinea]|uniref:Ferric oxidoreductase domain-containing protein n=1 Tax=Kitasatospora phosalacinea TaxID=2065 RepID=A0A9W6QBN2_9ACTN|nr:ferric reductase-like transmembrane domain-containing protein [Kitasatospora phosalacinea]GLW74115.1 hypothetical protein Kpho02_64130 [Kitasatospora phosalacinea]